MKHNLHNPFAPCAGLRLAILSATFLLSICMDAVAITWDGGSGGTNNWIGGSGSNSGERNWDTNSAPVANDPLVFAGTTRLTPNNNTTANTNYNGITFSSGAGAFTLTGNAITLGGNVANNSTNLQTINMNLILSGTRTFNASTGNLAVGGLISESGAGIGALIKTSSFTLTLTNQNTYTGGTTINAGTLALGHATNTLANIGAVNVDGASAILSIAGNSDTVGAVSLKNGAQITGSGGTLTGSSYAVESGSVSAILGGSASLTKSTSGTVTLSGANTYSGGTTINAGTLALGHATNTLANTSAVTIDGASAILSIAGNSDTVGAVSLMNGAQITGSGGTLTGSSYAVESGSVSAILGGSGISLTKSTAGTVTLSGANTYSGLTDVQAGTLTLGASNVFDNASTLKVSGGILSLLTFSDTVAGVQLTAGSITSSSGVLTSTTAFDLQAGSSSAILAGSAGANKTTAGTVTLSGANTYTGGTIINAGTLALGHATNTLANTSAVTIDGASAILSIAGNSDTVGAVSLKNGAQITGSGGTLTGSSYAVESGSVSAILGGSGISLTKSTAGTVTLSGANTYSGSTVINGGILSLASTGSINNSSGVVLNNGDFNVSAITGSYALASLAGNGSVTGDLTVSGTLGIGASPGTITFNDDLTLGGSSVSNFEITLGFSSYDLALSGLGSQTVNFGGTLNLLFDSGFNTVGSVKIFDFEGYNGNFTSVLPTGLAPGFTATFDQTTGIVTVVPEPKAAFLGSLGMFALLRRRRA